MIDRGGVKSVPSVPLKSSGARVVASSMDMRLRDEDDRDGGRNWALILLFSAMFSGPVWPYLMFLAI
ncbi:hypothetical protein [Rhizobium sp. RU36D]|uniref:hypothetical protein n=1 Tax=Rhizobium sp. RU36D TaxID=1907415 RepID=UPI0009D8738D|nr:hypothetical protein [Rhizobium sp. RU36D]SMC65198.1 hypothetical protein SAMN05880593_10487 [Rhizobium sp. RU36D]